MSRRPGGPISAPATATEPAAVATRRDFLTALSLLGGAGLLANCGVGERASSAVAVAVPPPALPAELWRASAKELAGAIARREVSSVEVLEAHLARIEAVNPQINAVVRLLTDEARAAAREADRKVATGAVLGPLHGVPVSIKDNLEVAGDVTTNGVPAYRDAIASADEPLIARLRAAGAIPFARTNLPDLALRTHTDSFLYGLTKNPWNAGRNVGGSSGGEAAALASGMSPLGIGNDIGGSLRIPAQCCGICSLKPTLGRFPKGVPAQGSPLSGQLMAVDGPMARRVADLLTAYLALAGPAVADPWSMPVALELERPAQPLRVALVPEPSGGSTHPSVAAGVRKAGQALAARGYAVEEIEPPRLADGARVWGQFLASELALVLDELTEVMSPAAIRFIRDSMPLLQPGDLGLYLGALAERQAIAAAIQEFHSRYPLIVGPVLTEPPFVIGFDLEHPDQLFRQMRFEVVWNLLGLPAVTVPVGVADGLPQGVEIVGGRYREDLCLEAGQVIEDALGIITPIDPRPG